MILKINSTLMSLKDAGVMAVISLFNSPVVCAETRQILKMKVDYSQFSQE